MFNVRKKHTVGYYLLIMFLLLFLFFSNDFGLLDVQKTAIVMAVGIDRQEDTFIVTSQVAIPQASKQGKATEAVQIVSRGKTIGEAFEEINAKTGWYPKLVFCDLIVLGEKTAEQNVFEALDYFLRDEYLSDNCFVTTCDGLAKDILNTSALVDPSSSTAIKKVLSAHAERVGTVLPSTLRTFAIGYFSDSESAYLPIIKPEPQQEVIGGETQPDNQSGDNSGGNSENSSQDGSSTQNADAKKTEDKPVFSAGETALFVKGKRVGRLTKSETFALSTLLSDLRLAAYSVEKGDKTCSLNIRHNASKIKLLAERENAFELNVQLTLNAGLLDYSKSQSLKGTSDASEVPPEFFSLAENKLSGEIQTVYEKCRKVNCDVFGVRERLIKYEKRRFHKQEDTAFQNTKINVSVRFQNVR